MNRQIVWEIPGSHTNDSYHYVLDNLQNLQRIDQFVFGKRQAMDYERPNEFTECTPMGYFSRLGRTYPEETILGIQGLKGTFGAKPAVDTTKDDGQTMTAGKIPSISFETDNATAIYHVNTLNSKRKTAQNDWKANLNVKRVAYGWIKPTGAINAKQRIFAFGTEAHNAPRFSLVIEADGRASVYDSFHSQNALVTTFVAVTQNAWNFVGMQFSSSGNMITATVTMNGEVYNTTYTNVGNFASLTRFHIGEPSPSLTIADLYKLDRGEAVNKPYPPRMPFRFSFAAVGSRIYNAAEFRGIYREGKKVLFGEPILSASGATWINPKPFNGMDIIPLNGSFSSLNRRQPKELNYTDPSFKAGKPKNFEWDPDLKRHVYGSYGTYLVLAPGNKSKLVYDLMLKNKGTISIRFKVKGSTPNERTILAFRNGSTNALKFSISSGKLRVTQGRTDLSFVQQSVTSDAWHWLAFRWDGTSYRVAFDDYATSRTASAPIDVTGCVTSVGCDLDTLGNPTKHLDGSIETLAFTESPFTNAWVSMLKDATPSSTRTYFDEVGRPTVKEIVDSGNTLRKSYIYKTNGAFDTTRIEREVNFLDQTILYGYDPMGKVTSIGYSGGANATALPKSKTYTYDSFGRLVSSKHGTTNHGYSYDKDGNILVKDGVTYTYDAAFKGRLRSRSDNTLLEYNDALPSNPTYIRKPGKAFALSWSGRRLKSAAGTTYEYNPEGIRIAKHAQNYDEYYALEGKQIAGLKRVEGGSETIALFRYDERGILTGFSLNGDEYFYERNVLGDITAVLDSNGHPVIAYDYDDWGVPAVKTIDSAKGYFVSKISRFLFKGYFHDEETGFYYLESRYYDPELARFISTDEASNLDPRAPTGMNPWAYCQNDPVNKFDPSGRFGLVIGLIGSFFVGFAVSVVSQGIQYGEVNWLQAGTDALFTVVSAALAYTGIGLLASTVINAGMGFAQYTLNATVFHDDFTWEGAAIATIWGAVAGYVGGEGAKNSASIKKNLDNAGRTSLKAIRTALKNHGTGTKFQRTLNLYAKRLAQSITKSISRAYTVSVLKIWKVSAFGLLIVSSIAFLNWIANMALTSINRN
ncbi:MAG: RHS repeat domain-containing protein [Candidatus Enteromonas sp.]